MTDINNEQILDDILQWLNEKIKNPGVEINSTVELISLNLLDSLGFLDFISFLEDKYEIELDPDLLVPEYFNTPADVASMVMNTMGKNA